MEEKDVKIPFYDWALGDWVVFANRYGIEIGVTLQVGGLLVSGTTTSGADFLENLGESLSEAAARAGDKFKVLSETFKNMYEKQAQKLYPKIIPEELNSSEEKQIATEPAFIHLKSVAIWADSQNSPIQVKYWRGKLGSVDAWFFGTIGTMTR